MAATTFRSPKEATLEYQLTGKEPKSQFGRVLEELDIEYIAAHSPQAKGRIERLFETLQARLVKELRKALACTLDETNQVLADYLRRFNRQFAQTEMQPGSANRQWPGARPPISLPLTIPGDATRSASQPMSNRHGDIFTFH